LSSKAGEAHAATESHIVEVPQVAFTKVWTFVAIAPKIDSVQIRPGQNLGPFVFWQGW
jgi:hypothetical protein